MKKPPTPEQAGVIHSTSALLVVKALAGTGKTTTLDAYAVAHPDKRILYLAYNKPIAAAAKGRFPSNVVCKTTHALAFVSFGRKYDAMKLDAEPGSTFQRPKLGNVRTSDIVMAMGVDGKLAKLIGETVNNYVYSADDELAASHIPSGARSNDRTAALRGAEELWAAMQAAPGEHRLAGKICMTHDGYLKQYHLSKPDLTKGADAYDAVMLDEYQDSNPVTADIVKSQRCPRILVGDEHQSIYSFRGSVGGMSEASRLPGAETHFLTNSFRFGSDVAALATALLAGFKEETHPLIGMGGSPDFATEVDRDDPYAHICRTNASVFRTAVECLDKKRVHFIGGVASYPFERLVDMQRLADGTPHLVKDPFFRSMKTIAKLRVYANETKDKEIGALLSVQKEYGYRIPKLVERITAAAMETQSGAQVILTTAHRSKGLEFDQVLLEDDFESFVDDRGRPAPLNSGEMVEELNLLYVASTRAMKALEVNASVTEALAALGRQSTFRMPKGSQHSHWVEAMFNGAKNPTATAAVMRQRAVAREALKEPAEVDSGFEP